MTSGSLYKGGMAFTFKDAASQIISAGQKLDAFGFAPATSGNYSMRLDSNEIAITVSGMHKGELTPEKIMRINNDGESLDGKKPSAETLLHTQLYRFFPHISAVLHTHSVPCVVLSRLLGTKKEIVLQGYELLKAFPGIETHDTAVHIPVFENTQDIAALAKDVDQVLANRKKTPAYIIRGHGLYGWGEDMKQALQVTEAMEVLLDCELKIRHVA